MAFTGGHFAASSLTFLPNEDDENCKLGQLGWEKNPIPAMEEQPQAVEAVDSEEHNGPSYGSLRCQGALLQGIFWMMNVYQDITGRFELPWCWKMEGRPCETPCETRMDTN